MFDFSVIIPHYNSPELLAKLINSIPQNKAIEVIVVDNSPSKIAKDEILSTRDFKLIYSAPKRGAGGARNEGIKKANGKWLIFADADDYFTNDAFEIFYSYINSDSDIIYTLVQSIYIDSGKLAERGELYNQLVRDRLYGKIDDYTLRINYNVPWGKMIKSTFVKNNNFFFDEVIASNDIFFGMITGVNADKVEVVDKVSYVVTTRYGSLTQRRNLQVLTSRYCVLLRYNKYLRSHGLSDYQSTSAARFLYMALSYGFVPFLKFLLLAIKYRQNILLGIGSWVNAYKKMKNDDQKESKYRIK